MDAILKKMLFECPILVDFTYLLHTYLVHVRQKIQTVTDSHCYVMHISVDRGTVVTLNIEIIERLG